MAISIVSASIVAVSIYCVYVVGLVIYRLYFHPLAKYPGPRHAAISRWPEFYYEVVQKGQFSKIVEGYHDKYGKRNYRCTKIQC